MEHKTENGCLKLWLADEDYNERVILKCFYWYTANFVVEITKDDDFRHHIILQPKDNQPLDSHLINRIKNDLVDFGLRDLVTNETRTIREIIIAKAFAYADLPLNPDTGVSDPAGFDPASIH